MTKTPSHLAARVAAWRHGWLLELIADRLGFAPKAVRRNLSPWLSHQESNERHLLRRMGARSLRIYQAADAVARELRIDLAAEWLRLQEADPKGIQLYEFLDLHRSEQIATFAAEWNLRPAGQGRGERIRSIVAVMRNVPLPRTIRPTGH